MRRREQFQEDSRKGSSFFSFFLKMILISRFVSFYMKKMQIGTIKSSYVNNSNNLPTQQTIFFRFVDIEWGFAQKTHSYEWGFAQKTHSYEWEFAQKIHFHEWGFALNLAFFNWGFALYFLWKGGLQHEKICIYKKNIQRNS